MQADLTQLPEYLKTRRWFSGKAWPIKDVSLVDHVDLEAAGRSFALAIVEVRYELGAPERYLLPVKVQDGRLIEAIDDDELMRALLELVREGGRVASGGGALVGERAEGSDQIWSELPASPSVRRIQLEQTNTSIVFGEAVVLKLLRKVEPGVNPEREMGLFLARRHFTRAPELVGWLQLLGPADAAVAVLHRFVRDARDGWRWVLEAFRAGERPSSEQLALVRRLGERVGEMHLCLASDETDPRFAPEPILGEDFSRWSSSIIGQLGVALAEVASIAPELYARRTELTERAKRLAHLAPSGQKLRVHGDLHLGQVLLHEGDWLIFDFEGEPNRSYAQRREKHSPLKDVAGMLRSFTYAEAAVVLSGGKKAGRDAAAREAFLNGYWDATRSARFLPADGDALEGLLDALELEKAIYELRYELHHRPEWVRIPIASLMEAAHLAEHR